jgi:hypothetical protein
MFKRVTRKEHSQARQYAHKILGELRERMKSKYRFYTRFVGSGKWGTVIRDTDGRYDLDYQIILTKNSRIYKDDKKFDPTITKQDFYGKLESIINKKGLEDSTTAITFNNSESDYSFDFVIIDGTVENDWKIIRRNNTDSRNQYTWNEIPSGKNYLNYYKSLPEVERYELGKEIMRRKTIDKKRPFYERKGSCTINTEVLEEHRYKHEHKK